MLERWSHYAALPLRIVLGCWFVVLGLQKLAGYFGGPGLGKTAELMVSGGLTPGTFWAWVVGLLELLGGAAGVPGRVPGGVGRGVAAGGRLGAAPRGAGG